jgi:hypothetical protein
MRLAQSSAKLRSQRRSLAGILVESLVFATIGAEKRQGQRKSLRIVTTPRSERSEFQFSGECVIPPSMHPRS